jgi:hypothetical protein
MVLLREAWSEILIEQQAQRAMILSGIPAKNS